MRMKSMKYIGLFYGLFAASVALILPGCANSKLPPSSSSMAAATEVTKDQLKNLKIQGFEPIQAKPGEIIHLRIKTLTYEITPPQLINVDGTIKAKWSISPEAGIQLNTHTGELRIEETATPGAQYTISALVSKGKHQQTINNTLNVYSTKSNPFVGSWKDTHSEINELTFKANGEFSVTAIPFEVYKDYWGKYSFDLNQKTILFEVKGGNMVPTDSDLQGSFSFFGHDTLVLDDIYFGALTQEMSKELSKGGKKRDSYRFVR